MDNKDNILGMDIEKVLDLAGKKREKRSHEEGKGKARNNLETFSFNNIVKEVKMDNDIRVVKNNRSNNKKKYANPTDILENGVIRFNIYTMDHPDVQSGEREPDYQLLAMLKEYINRKKITIKQFKQRAKEIGVGNMDAQNLLYAVRIRPFVYQTTLSFYEKMFDIKIIYSIEEKNN